MHNFTYENQGSNRILICELREDEKIDEMALGMVNQNKITGMLPVSFAQMDTERYFRYSGLLAGTLKNVMGGKVNRKWILTVLENICDIIRKSEDYLLDVNAFVLDMEYIFVDNISGRTELVYLPVLNQSEASDFAVFFKDVVTSIITDPAEDGTYVTRMLNYLNMTDNFSLLDFLRLVKELKLGEAPAEERKGKPERKDASVKARPAEPAVLRAVPPMRGETPAPPPTPAPAPKPAQQPSPKKSVEGAQRKAEKQRPAPEFEIPGDDLSFEVPGGVMVQSPKDARRKQTPQKQEAPKSETSEEDKMSVWSLLRNFNGENLEKFRSQGKGSQEQKPEKKAKEKKKGGKGKNKGVLTLVSLNPAYPRTITVDKDNYAIGRRKSNDAVLSGMPEISREHCMIVHEGDAYYVIDQRSTFGTVVDGAHCEPGKKSKELSEGSVIDLPGIQFRVEFR